MDNKLIENIKLQLDDLVSAHSRLTEAIAERPTMMNRDATIQRFEFTFELCWKILKTINMYFNSECYNPRECFRYAAQNGMIDDPTVWFDYLESRNIASHAYDEEKAKQVYSITPQFAQDAQKLILVIKDKFR